MKCSLFSTAGFFLTVLASSAADAPAAVKQVNMLEMLSKGGIVMFPLGILSIVTVVLILLYLVLIRKNSIVSDRFMDTAEALVKKRDYLALNDYCQSQGQAMARIVQKAANFIVRNPGASAEHVRSLAETEGVRQAGLLQTRITYLADIGSIAPMVGLVGTVIGMMKSFIEISSQGGKGVKQMELAQGVGEALVTTASGLAISILALVFYAYFRGRVQRCISELEAAAAHLIGLLCSQLERNKPAGTPPPHPHHTASGYAEPLPTPRQTPLGIDRPDLHGI
ncbi:MAG: MotA/TolQ/ExbB proton channel family protein [Luteolibacter sp.]